MRLYNNSYYIGYCYDLRIVCGVCSCSSG